MFYCTLFGQIFNRAELKTLLRVSLKFDDFEQDAPAHMEWSHLAIETDEIGQLAKREEVF